MNKLKVKNHSQNHVGYATLEKILAEVRLLRKEVGLILPQEDINEYARPDEIKKSYQKAIRNYPHSL